MVQAKSSGMSHTHGLPHRFAPNHRFSERKSHVLFPSQLLEYHILFAILATYHTVVK